MNNEQIKKTILIMIYLLVGFLIGFLFCYYITESYLASAKAFAQICNNVTTTQILDKSFEILR